MINSTDTIDDCQMVSSTTATSSSGNPSQVAISTSLLPPPSALIYPSQGYTEAVGSERQSGFSNDFMSNEKLMGILDEVLILIDDSEDLFAGNLVIPSSSK